MMRWADTVVHKGEIRNAYTNLVRKLGGKIKKKTK
jgi:hypothetical protein